MFVVVPSCLDTLFFGPRRWFLLVIVIVVFFRIRCSFVIALDLHNSKSSQRSRSIMHRPISFLSAVLLYRFVVAVFRLKVLFCLDVFGRAVYAFFLGVCSFRNQRLCLVFLLIGLSASPGYNSPRKLRSLVLEHNELTSEGLIAIANCLNRCVFLFFRCCFDP